MATYTVDFAAHKTLTANAIDTVVLKDNSAEEIEVFNRGTSGYIYFTKNGSDPAINGDNTYIAAPGASYTVTAKGAPDTIKLICGTANAYSVTGDEDDD